MALTGTFFASNDEADTPKSDSSVRTSSNEAQKIQETATPTPEPSTIANINKSRPIFSRNHGYQLVKTKEEIEVSHLTPWLTKSSTYSLLSNVSTDSFLSEMEGEVGSQNMVRLENCSSRRPGQARSESVQNFASAARSSIPRSLTTVRFNPFDPNKEAINVKRDDTFDITTSDYASEIDEPFPNTSFVGISNPVYTEFSSCVAEGEDLLAGEHRNFAQALNPSLLTKNSVNRATKLRNEVLSQLLRLNMVNERRSTSNVVPTRILEESPDSNNSSEKQGVNSSVYEDEWSILMLGGREPIPLTIFDRPLSIWMFRL